MNRLFKKTSLLLGIILLGAGSVSAFSLENNLTDAPSVATDFNEYISSHNNGGWSYTDDYALAQDGTANTVLQGGAVLDFVTTDDDTARSYLGTIDSDWLDTSWTAHIAIEAPASTRPTIYFGLGDPTPNESAFNEPRQGDSTFVYWQSGNSGSKIRVNQNGSVVHDTATWQGDPGYDIYMTYNHLKKTILFEIDNWNGGRFSDIDVTTAEVSVDGTFSDTNDVHIFFGANAKVTFGDFWVKEAFQCVHPGIPLTVEDLDHVKANLSVEPWLTGYNDLLSSARSSLTYSSMGPHSVVGRTTNNVAFERDMEAVHNMARLWYFTEDEAYAQKARDILLSWAENHTEFLTGETYLTMGYHAWQVFEGADILRGTWPGWTQADTDSCKAWFEDVWWDTYHVHVPGPLRSANQGMANLLPAIGVAVFNDDEEKFNQCLQAFRAGPAGALMDSLPNGQVGDSGRDVHSQGQIKLMAWAAEVFWKQGVDVYAEHDNRLLAAAEYYSRAAMGFETPFVAAGTVYDIYPRLNSLASGGTNHTYFLGPDVFNVLHGAYVVRKGMSAPYLEKYLSCFEQNKDSFHYLKASDMSTAAIPAPLTAPAAVASVTSLNGVNMGDCTSGGEWYNSGTWTVSGAGTRMSYSTSEPDYRLSYLPVTGDATIIAQLTDLSWGSLTDARAGLVFTESIGNSDVMAAVVITAEDADDELQTWYRGETAHSHDNGNPFHGKPNQARPRMPYWLKIERIGERITLFTSPDGASWSTAGVADYDGLADTAYFGLAVSSDQYSSTATATFTDVRITGGDGGEASTVPEAPFAIYASPGGTEVPLRWLESFEADSYKIWRSTTSGGPYTLLTQEAGTSFVDTNVVPDTRYYYAVSAANSHGESALSPEDTFHYRAKYIEAEDFAARGGDARSVGGCSDWCGGDKVGYINDGEWSRYDNIQIGPDSVFRARVASNLHPTNGTSRIEVYLDAIDGTLIGSVDVPYTGSTDRNWETVETAVSSVSGTHSVYLKYVETTASGVTGAGLFDVNWFGFVNTNIAPDSLTASSVSATQLDLSWSPVIGATEYILKRSPVSGGPYTEQVNVIDEYYSDTGVTLGTEYYYIVSAIVDGQETAPSAELIGKTGELPPTTATQFFTNNLTVASSVAVDFTENIASTANSVWSYTNDYALAQDGSANTVLQGGAVIDFVTVDDDTARSYLATVYSNYLDTSWTAHIGVETDNVNPKNYIFFGLGAGIPNTGDYHEPTAGQGIHVQWQSGNSNSKIKVIRNNTQVEDTGTWQGDPGYDIYMTYNHINKTVKFEIDNWNGGRFSDIDVTTLEHSIDGYLTNTNDMHIYFGGNAVMTFRDFDVYEIDAETPPVAPSGVYTVIGNMAVEVKWDAAGGADAYVVKRSIESGSGYVTIASNVTDLSYVDTTVETNVIYHYVVSASNAYGTSDDSEAATGKGFPYDRIGPDSSYGAGSPLDMDNLFDGDIDVFADTTMAGSWAGVDLGDTREVQRIDYVFRDWSWRSLAYGSNATFEACNDPTFPEGEVVVLGTIPTDAAAYPAVNTLTVSDTSLYRYVRVKGRTGNPDARPLYFLAELDFITAAGIARTSRGTLHSWLDGYYDVATQFGGDYELADLSDTDGDGLLAWEEYVAGLNPIIYGSLSVEGLSFGATNSFSWDAVSGRVYNVYWSSNLVEGFSLIESNALNGLYIDSEQAGEEAGFYKITVELEP